MDKTQIVTIVVTAVVSVIAKELVIWFVTLIKNTIPAQTITAIIRTAFNKTNRAVIFDLFSLLFYISVLISFAINKSPPSRIDILIAIGATLVIILMICFLFIDIIKAINAAKKP